MLRLVIGALLGASVAVMAPLVQAPYLPVIILCLSSALLGALVVASYYERGD